MRLTVLSWGQGYCTQHPNTRKPSLIILFPNAPHLALLKAESPYRVCTRKSWTGTDGEKLHSFVAGGLIVLDTSTMVLKNKWSNTNSASPKQTV